jgi:hypothetical protein
MARHIEQMSQLAILGQSVFGLSSDLSKASASLFTTNRC